MTKDKKPKTLIFGMDVKESTGKDLPKQGVAIEEPEKKKKTPPKKKDKDNKTPFFGN
jgi:hypothetical protein